MGRRYGRREALAAGATGLVTATTGCLGLLSSGSDPDLATVDFAFTYESGDGDGAGGAVTVEHAGGDGLQAGNLRIRTEDGDEAAWSALGSTVEQADELVTTGSTARIGADVLNWPSPVPPGELARVVYASSEQSVTELDRFVQPTPTATASPTSSPTPTATPTPAPTATPVPGLITGFEDGHLGDWSVADRGASGSARWTVTGDTPFAGDRAAKYRGDREKIIASTSGLGRYPERGEVCSVRWYKAHVDAKGGFGFGVQSPSFEEGYRVYIRSHNWENQPDTAFLRVRTGDGYVDLDTTAYDTSAYTGEYLRWVVEWGHPTIRVRAFDGSGDRILTLAADDDRYDSGGVAIEGNASDPSTLYVDRVRVEGTV